MAEGWIEILANLPEGEPFKDSDGAVVLGWAERVEGDEEPPADLIAEAELEFARMGEITARPVLCRELSDVEARIRGWDEGSFVRCTERARNPKPYWQIVLASDEGGE